MNPIFNFLLIRREKINYLIFFISFSCLEEYNKISEKKKNFEATILIIKDKEG